MTAETIPYTCPACAEETKRRYYDDESVGSVFGYDESRWLAFECEYCGYLDEAERAASSPSEDRLNLYR